MDDGATTPEAAERVAAAEREAELARREAARARGRADELTDVVAVLTSLLEDHRAGGRRAGDPLEPGALRDALAPLLRGLARLADDLRRIGAPGPGAASPAGATAAEVAYLAASVEDLLHDAGVTALDPAVGEPFDPRLHHAAGTRPTADALEDGTIAAVSRRGLRRDDGRLLRPAEVEVRRFSPRLADADA